MGACGQQPGFMGHASQWASLAQQMTVSSLLMWVRAMLNSRRPDPTHALGGDRYSSTDSFKDSLLEGLSSLRWDLSHSGTRGSDVRH